MWFLETSWLVWWYCTIRLWARTSPISNRKAALEWQATEDKENKPEEVGWWQCRVARREPVVGWCRFAQIWSTVLSDLVSDSDVSCLIISFCPGTCLHFDMPIFFLTNKPGIMAGCTLGFFGPVLAPNCSEWLLHAGWVFQTVLRFLWVPILCHHWQGGGSRCACWGKKTCLHVYHSWDCLSITKKFSRFHSANGTAWHASQRISKEFS